jgi:hypothetical protein
METEAPLACIESVKILSVTSAPPLDPIPVGLHTFEHGRYKRTVQMNMRATYFDDVVVSSVFERLPSFRYPVVTYSSARDFARNAVAAGKQARASVSVAHVYAEPVLDLRAFVPNNMAHLLLDIIPYTLLARDVVGPGLRVLTQPVRGPFLELLGIFGISPIWQDRRVTGRMIKMSGTRGLAVYDLLSTFDCNGVHFAPRVYANADFPSGFGFERIFLARRAPRSLENQAEIETVTNRYGYKTVFMEDYSVRDQLAIAAQARHVVAVHGAAISLLMVNRGLESVVEILPPNVYHQLFPTCLGRRVRRYDQIVPEHDPRVAHCGWEAIQYFKNRNFSVDAALLDRLLLEIS